MTLQEKYVRLSICMSNNIDKDYKLKNFASSRGMDRVEQFLQQIVQPQTQADTHYIQSGSSRKIPRLATSTNDAFQSSN